jgi:multiple sugar transport system permease protein
MTARRVLPEIGRHGALILLLGFLLLPVWVMLKTSFTPYDRLYVWPPEFLPTSLDLGNYARALFGQYRVVEALGNSLIIASCAAAISTSFGFLGAYGLARFRFTGRTTLLFVVLATQMLSPIVIVIPLYEFMIAAGLLDTYLSVILCDVALATPIAIWLLHGFLLGIPRELEEAAMVDGCSRLKSLWHIILPVVRPGLAMTAIYTFIHAWSDLIFPLVMLTDDSKWPVTLALTRFVGENVIRWDYLMAAGVVTTLPAAILFALVQKHFTRGMIAGAVKG